MSSYISLSKLLLVLVLSRNSFFILFIGLLNNELFLGLHLLLLILLMFALSFLISLLFPSDKFIENLGVVIVDVLVDTSFESLHKFFLDLLFNVGRNQCFCLSYPISLFSLFLDRNDLLSSLKFHFPHLDEHLSQLGKSLLALVNDKWRPINELLVNLFNGLLVVLIELDFFPEFIGLVCTFCSFHVQVANTLLLSDCSILRIGQWTWLSIAQTCQVVLVSAKVLALCSGNN